MRKAINITEIILGALFLIYYVVCGIADEFVVPILYLWLILGAVLLIKGIAALRLGKHVVFTIFDIVFLIDLGLGNYKS